MAAVFLVTLFEYSPLFYIAVVSLCFFITAAMVLGWFGFDVPVILRSFDESESILTSEKHMVQVTNPFTLELGSGAACVADGMSVRPRCLEPCVLSCFWGCEVRALQRALHTHQNQLQLSTPQHFEDALHPHYHYCQRFFIGSEDGEERHTKIPTHHDITDFGPPPRDRYPLVAVLTLAEAAARNTYNIVASVTVVHVPDDRYKLYARVLFQYLLTSQGNLYELKPLFMSADSQSVSAPPDTLDQNSQLGEPDEEAHEEVQEEDWCDGTGKDCVVCQNAAVNRVLLPCRHACVCDGCVSHFQHCPICRAFVLESFTLTRAPAPEA
ncbi:cell growth regulator with RING finger domain protein 1 isoform 1-T1 [Pholidichthys leucotaenia]